MAMKLETSDRPDLKTLIAAIARSAIVVREGALSHGAAPLRAGYDNLTHLPAGYGKVDVAILRWIAADSRRASHRSN